MSAVEHFISLRLCGINFGAGNKLSNKCFLAELNPLKETIMKQKLLMAAAAVTIFATPALADFWIVRDSPTANCRVVEQRPTDTKVTIVGGNKVYTSRTEAEREMTVVCTK